MLETAGEAALPPHLIHEGEVIDGRYRIEAVIGGGGMATVYRASHAMLEQPVAVKVVSPEVRAIPGAVQRFLREARAATQLRGEHVVRVFDVGTTADGSPYMVMELLVGQDLGEVVAAKGALSVADAVEYVLQACEALAEVHGVGIVHRDLKPANLVLTTGTDGRPCVKLIDFGVSRVDHALSAGELASITHPEAIVGSPRYMAPEQMERAANADARSDIWGMGAVLYELLAGDAPYDGDTFWEIYASAKKGPPPAASARNERVPPALDAVVLRCLHPDPGERYGDVAELAAALAPFGADAATCDRAESIERVLAATRTRAGGEPSEPLVAEARSRIRRRVPGVHGSSNGRRVAALLVLLGIGAAAATVAARTGLLTGARRARAPTVIERSAPTADPRYDVPLPEPKAEPSATATATVAKPAATATPTATPTPTPTATPTPRRVARTPGAPAPMPSPVASPEPAPSEPESLFEDRQ